MNTPCSGSRLGDIGFPNSRHRLSVARHRVAICLLINLMLAFIVPPAISAPLSAPPLGERWFSIAMNGERVGFAHVTISPAENGYLITSESSAKLLVLGFSREATAREHYLVNRDLSLRSFDVEQLIDKSPLDVSGRIVGNAIKVTVETKGGKQEKSIKARGKVFPPAVLNLYPLLHGVAAGRSCKLQMLDTEAVKVKEVNISVVGFETLNGIETVHLRNDLYPVVENDIWVDLTGNTIQESVRDGLILTRAEDASNGRLSLLEDAVAKRDLALDFSLIRIDREIANPQGLRRLVLELTNFPTDVPLLEGPGQTVSRLPGHKVRFTITSPLRQDAQQGLSPQEQSGYLSTTPRVNTDNPEIVARQREIVAGSPGPMQSVTRLAGWVADHVKDTVTDSQSALETLKLGSGNCQSHARLYVALARAAGIPSRMVSGLVYATGKGFLYHSWAESFVNGWMAVDPTFGQEPADITHIKLAEGDEPAELAPLAGVIGRVRARSIELQ